MCGCEDPAEVRVTLPALAEQRDVPPAFEGHLRAGDRPDAGVLRGVRELEGAVDAVVVGKGERRVAELRRAGDELLGMRGAVEERVRRVAVELDIRGGTHGSPTDTLLHRTSPTVARLASRAGKAGLRPQRASHRSSKTEQARSPGGRH